jgi:glutathione S-transferase
MEKTPVLFYKEGACSLGSLITAIWLGEPFYVSRVEDKDTSNGDFLAINPMGEVPTLFIDGKVITENIAVLTHLAFQDLSKKLIFAPATIDFDEFMRVLGFLTSSFHKSFAPLYLAVDWVSDPKVQEEIKMSTVQGSIREMFSYVDEHLLRTTFMYDRPMAIDAYLFAMVRWGDELFDIGHEFPHIKRFQDAMAKNEGVQFALAIESQKQTQAFGAFKGVKNFNSFVHEAAARKNQIDLKNGDGEFSPGVQIHHNIVKERAMAMKHA